MGLQEQKQLYPETKDGEFREIRRLGGKYAPAQLTETYFIVSALFIEVEHNKAFFALYFSASII